MTNRSGDGLPIVSLQLRYEHDVVLARQRARQVARHAGFESQDQVRFATAVSELARNAYQYAGGGRVHFLAQQEGDRSLLVARVSDTGPGIADLPAILQGRYTSATGMGLGIIGARRLSDRFDVESEVGKGTAVIIGKLVPQGRRLDGPAIATIADAILREEASTPFEELQRQNQELLSTLDQLRESKANVDRLNHELEETNRGVVALYAELDERAEAMRRMSETKTRFLSDMSHELRTPLTSIINLTRLLLSHVDGPLNSEQMHQATLVHRSALSLVEMVSDLLDIAKIEAGHVELRVTSFSVNELFASLRGMFRPIVSSERVSFVIEEPDAPILMRTDEQRVAQVLRNFVSNALKFTTDGEVRVRAEPLGEQVRLTVTDTGTGIAPADLERIFEDYAQVDGPIQRRVRGTGLGLPLTRKLAALLSGHVFVQSTPGVGSTFTLEIPRELTGGDPHG